MSRSYAHAPSRPVNATRYRTGSDFGPGERFGDGVGAGARGGSFDQTLMYTTIALVVVGLVSVFTASAAQADLETGNSLTTLLKQLISAVIGGGALVFFIGFPFERLKRLARPFSAICVGLLLMTMFMGTTANGSERWIMLPFGGQFGSQHNNNNWQPS